MNTGADIVAKARALQAAALGYGSRALNGKPQRGPDYYDCIGFVRAVYRAVAPGLWPTSWGGSDSWTVPDFYYARTAHGLYVGGPDHPIAAGDALVFGTDASPLEHIGIADGAGNVISALNTRDGVCMVPIGTVAMPLTYVLPTALPQELAMQPVTFDPAARIGTVALSGAHYVYRLDNGELAGPYPAGSTFDVFAFVTANGADSYLVVPPDVAVPCAMGKNPEETFTPTAPPPGPAGPQYTVVRSDGTTVAQF